MAMPPMSMPQMQPQPQRFFHNNNNFNGMNNFNNHRPTNNGHHNFINHYDRNIRPQQFNQQRPAQQAPPPAASNPFIPLQASRKATKAKSQKSEAKRLPEGTPVVVQQAVKPVEKKAAPEASRAEHAATTSSDQPSVDNRKCRLAISFGK